MTEAGTARGARRRRSTRLLSHLLGVEEVGILAALLILATALALTADGFLAPDNLLDVARQASDYGVMAVGMVFLLAMGEIDLSVGSVLMLTGVVAAVALRAGVPVPAALLLGLGLGAACGAANGLLSVLLRVPTIIVTLGTMSVFMGLGLVVTESEAVGMSDFPQEARDSLFFAVGYRGVFGVPVGVLVMLVVAALGHVLLNHTPFGWRVMAVGSNRQAARFSGIPIAAYRVAAMTIMGFVAALAGMTALAFHQSGNPQSGRGAEIFVIAAAIIGGTPLSGGSGSVPGAVLGALLIALIRNGLQMWNVNAYWSIVVTGAVIIAAVAVGTLIKRR